MNMRPCPKLLSNLAECMYLAGKVAQLPLPLASEAWIHPHTLPTILRSQGSHPDLTALTMCQTLCKALMSAPCLTFPTLL